MNAGIPPADAMRSTPMPGERRLAIDVSAAAALVLLLVVAAAPFFRMARRDIGVGTAAGGLGAALVGAEFIGQGPLVFLPTLVP